MIFRGSRPVLLRNPIFCDFSGGGGGPDPLSSPLDPHMHLNFLKTDGFHASHFFVVVYTSIMCKNFTLKFKHQNKFKHNSESGTALPKNHILTLKEPYSRDHRDVTALAAQVNKCTAVNWEVNLHYG